MHKKSVIAIDGPAASGKGTLARRIAAELGYAHMDTGALYRAVAVIAVEKQIEPINAATWLAKNFSPQYLDNPALRSDEAGQAASRIAAIPQIRETLLFLQRSFAQNVGDFYKGAVLDGRDIGTVICPNADAKLYITAEAAIRAHRRTKELQSRGIAVMYDTVLNDMRERDTRDTQRAAAPLRPPEDAYVLETDKLTPEQVFEKAMAFIKSKLA